MSEQARNRLAAWAPVILSLFGNAIFIGMFYGVTTTEIAHLKEADSSIRTELMPMEKRMAIWMPRAESDAKFSNLERELSDLKEMVRECNNKIDLLTRQSVR